MGNGEKECFERRSPFDDDQNDDEDDDDEISEGKNGSSSNSTVEESEKKPSVRPYVRSKMPRLRWTPDLHLRFMHAVERLGGQERATPKLVLQFMGIKGLNISHVKSHLQMYRSKRIDESNQGMKDQRFFMEGVDRNIYNLSQLPLLPTFNQRQNSNISFPRNGDGSWIGNGKWMQNSNISNNKTRPGFYGTSLDSHYYNHRSSSVANNHHLHLFSKTSPFVERSSTWRTNNEHPKHEEYYGSLLHDKQEPLLLGQSRQNPIELNSSIPIQTRVLAERVSSDTTHTDTRAGLKRKNSDLELDLNLSLAVESRSDDGQRGISPLDDDDEDLALSLYTSPSSYSKIVCKKLKEDVVGNENARGASTLDLTL